ncbi:hypothetical protein [Absidia glauca]|uniref:GATA-type domain-containing protein n=1 Tax=Absidia glauca TaxID=4829 RepID=A0A168NFN6_ABSGL|nr:hypothetical protein [Absidia glauca]
MSPLTENKICDRLEPNRLTPDAWIADTFDTCKLSQGVGVGHEEEECVDGLTCPKYKVRCLGSAYVKSGSFSAVHATFYEVLRWETSDHNYDDDDKASQPSRGSPLGHGASNGNDGTAPFPDIAGDLLYSFEKLPKSFPTLLAQGCNDLSTSSDVGSLALSPEKRKHHHPAQRCVIFIPQNLGASSPGDMSQLSSDHTYYLFPHDSLVKAVTDEAPFQIFCTFYLPKSSSPLSLNRTGSHSPPSSRIRSVTACGHIDSDCLFSIGHHDTIQQSMDRAINIEISGAPAGIYSSLKQATLQYQELCKRITNLLSLHDHHSTTCKTGLAPYPERSLRPSPSMQQTQLHDLGPECHTKIETKEYDYLEQQLHDPNACDPSNHHAHRQHSKNNDVIVDDKDCLQASIYRHKEVQRNTAPGRKRSHVSAAIRQCSYCRTRSTPMWRRGPEGAGTLCNACGVKWKHGKILSDSEGLDHVHSRSVITTPNIDQDDNNDHSTAVRKRKPPTTYIKKAKRTRINETRKQGIAGNYSVDTASYSHHTVTLSSSSDSTFNSPLTSFTSSPHSSPPMSFDAQQYRGLLTLALAENFELDSDALPLDTGVDDVEAAAVLTLLRQS